MISSLDSKHDLLMFSRNLLFDIMKNVILNLCKLLFEMPN